MRNFPIAVVSVLALIEAALSASNASLHCPCITLWSATVALIDAFTIAVYVIAVLESVVIVACNTNVLTPSLKAVYQLENFKESFVLRVVHGLLVLATAITAIAGLYLMFAPTNELGVDARALASFIVACFVSVRLIMGLTSFKVRVFTPDNLPRLEELLKDDEVSWMDTDIDIYHKLSLLAVAPTSTPPDKLEGEQRYQIDAGRPTQEVATNRQQPSALYHINESAIELNSLTPQ